MEVIDWIIILITLIVVWAINGFVVANVLKRQEEETERQREYFENLEKRLSEITEKLRNWGDDE